MTTYQTKDGQCYEATDASNLVDQLREDSWLGVESSKAAWRREAASRAAQSGAAVRADSDAHFVADLIIAGLIKETTKWTK
jgi:hypothetical protein